MNLYWLGALASGMLVAAQGVLVSRVSAAGGLLLTVASLSLAQAFFPAMFMARAGLPADWRLSLLGGCIAGIVGTMILLLNVVATRHLGASSTFLYITAGLVITSAFMDHMGWSGVTKDGLDPGRLLGIFLVLGGVGLISSR